MTKNLLFVGSVGGMSFSTKLAKSMGHKVVSVDYFEDSQAKKYADKSYLISTTDLDALKKIVVNEKIDGIFTGFSDVNIRTVSQLCSHFNMPCYITEKQLLLLQDKRFFKDLCYKYGINTPKMYKEGDAVSFPVIVKPSDSYASKGITVCKDEKELEFAIQKAKQASRNGEIVIEDYLEGREIMVHFVMLNGKLKISSAYDRILSASFTQNKIDIAPLAIYNVNHYVDIAIPFEKRLENMFRDLGFTNLIGFLQSIYCDGEVYFFETAVRFGGNASEIFNYYQNDVDIIGKFIEFSYSGKMNDDDFDKISPYYGKFCCNISLLLKQGTVAQIIEDEDLSEIEGIYDIQKYCYVNTEIKKEKLNSYNDIGYRILVILDDKEDLKRKIEEIKNKLFIYDTDGNNMIRWDLFDDIDFID